MRPCSGDLVAQRDGLRAEAAVGFDRMVDLEFALAVIADVELRVEGFVGDHELLGRRGLEGDLDERAEGFEIGVIGACELLHHVTSMGVAPRSASSRFA